MHRGSGIAVPVNGVRNLADPDVMWADWDWFWLTAAGKIPGISAACGRHFDRRIREFG